MIETLDQWDKTLLLWMNYDGGAVIDQFWFLYSGKWTWVPLYALMLTLMVLKCRKDLAHHFWRHLGVLVVLTTLLIVLSDQISSGLIKHWVERPRPSHAPELEGGLHLVNDYRGGAFGFVSSHAANSIAIALWLAYLMWHKTSPLAQRLFSQITWPQKRRFLTMLILLVSWALLNCYSRIYLGVHYPGDILGGLMVGTLSFLIVHRIYAGLLSCSWLQHH